MFLNARKRQRPVEVLHTYWPVSTMSAHLLVIWIIQGQVPRSRAPQLTAGYLGFTSARTNLLSQAPLLTLSLPSSMYLTVADFSRCQPLLLYYPPPWLVVSLRMSLFLLASLPQTPSPAGQHNSHLLRFIVEQRFPDATPSSGLIVIHLAVAYDQQELAICTTGYVYVDCILPRRHIDWPHLIYPRRLLNHTSDQCRLRSCYFAQKHNFRPDIETPMMWFSSFSRRITLNTQWHYNQIKCPLVNTCPFCIIFGFIY